MLPQTSLSILVIDDEASIGRALSRLLHQDGYRVDTADNGRQALALLSLHLYDLILCDLRMPELDGPTFYGILLRQYPSLAQRIIFLTGDTLSLESQIFLKQCSQPWLLKPCMVADIRFAIEQVLRGLPREGVV